MNENIFFYQFSYQKKILPRSFSSKPSNIQKYARIIPKYNTY